MATSTTSVGKPVVQVEGQVPVKVDPVKKQGPGFFTVVNQAIENATSPSAAVGSKAGAPRATNWIQDTFVKPMITEFSSLAAKKGDHFLLAGLKNVIRFNDQVGVEISKRINGICEYAGPVGSLVGVVLSFLVRTGMMAVFTTAELVLAAVAVAVGLVTSPFWGAAAVVSYLDNDKMDRMIDQQKKASAQLASLGDTFEEIAHPEKAAAKKLKLKQDAETQAQIEKLANPKHKLNHIGVSRDDSDLENVRVIFNKKPAKRHFEEDDSNNIRPLKRSRSEDNQPQFDSDFNPNQTTTLRPVFRFANNNETPVFHIPSNNQ